ncbi:lantibiotic dehydratase [Chitinophaga sp. HK235]|uniref:lantibiotic dehydratase n=1 Tax=Chitinophaga sp. HK235 TaxID=2952571 RepID=UPI001BA90C00|nr:lantibiotic dehydratase [Chitinophaga sp. HK235]
MTLKIFPYALVRYAAMPFHELKAMEIQGLSAYMAAAEQLETNIRQQQNALCDQLYIAIQSATDNRARQGLLQLKRTVYNGRMPATDIHVDNPALDEQLCQYRQLLEKKHALQQEWQLQFEEQQRQHRQQLQRWAQQELLRKGILLSSPVLYAQLDSFVGTDPAAFKIREQKNEYSLLRYITRMAAKTSPFSTFTYTGTATLDMDSRQATQSPSGIISNVRLNNSLFAYLRALIIHHPVLNELLEVRLNATATIDETHVHFLVNYFNVEAFQRLPARNLALWLYHYLQEQTVPHTIAALTAILAPQIPDADRESIKSFLLKLAASGLLELSIGCSGVDPEWDSALAVSLSAAAHQHPSITSLYNLLITLKAKRKEYVTACSANRFQLLQEAAHMLNTTTSQLQTEAGLKPSVPGESLPPPVATPSFEVNHFIPRYFMPQDIFYEDASIKENNPLPAKDVQILIDKAERLCRLLEPFDMLQEERKNMCDFFLQHYGPAQTISITGFYHAYYLQVKKQQAKQAESPVMEMPETLQLEVDGVQVNITGQGLMPASGAVSRGMFVQLFYTGEDTSSQLHGVVNALLPGMGKVAGRFLHLFDPGVTAAFREWNKALYPAHKMMELNDGSVFNANIHPPLLDHEIAIPGGSNNYSPEQHISLKTVMLRYDAEQHRLCLYDRGSGKEVYAYDLCLESFYNRSHFYRLLAHFNPEPRLPLRGLIAAVDRRQADQHKADAPVKLKPRIVFEERLVLRRQGWLVDTADIPIPVKGEPDAAYFLRLQQWRINHHLPEQVFVFLKSPYIPASPDKAGNLHRDDYKPQYISFIQPLLVGVFRKMLTRAGAHCYLEEVLPDAGKQATVTEHMLHWYKY